jgi:hypothetical protein
MPVEIVGLVLTSMVHQEILLFGDELQDFAGAVFESRRQLYGQSRTRLLAKSSVDATTEIDPEPRRITPAVLALRRFHRDATHRADR